MGLINFKNFHFFENHDDVIINDLLKNIFYVFFQKVLIIEKRKTTFLVDINNVLVVKLMF